MQLGALSAEKLKVRWPYSMCLQRQKANIPSAETSCGRGRKHEHLDPHTSVALPFRYLSGFHRLPLPASPSPALVHVLTSFTFPLRWPLSSVHHPDRLRVQASLDVPFPSRFRHLHSQPPRFTPHPQGTIRIEFVSELGLEEAGAFPFLFPSPSHLPPPPT